MTQPWVMGPIGRALSSATMSDLSCDKSLGQLGERSPEGGLALEHALHAVIADLGAETGTIHLLDAEGVLVLRAAQGIPAAVLAIVARVPVGKGMAGLSVERNAAVSACNIQTDTSGEVRPGARATGMEGAIVVPIRAPDGRAIGALGVANRSARTFSEDEIAKLLAAGEAIAAQRAS